MENGNRTQWYVIGMAMSIIVITLLILLAIIFTFVLTVDTGEGAVNDDAALVEEAPENGAVEFEMEETPEPDDESEADETSDDDESD